MEQEYIDCIERIKSEVNNTADINTLVRYIYKLESIIDTSSAMVCYLEKDRTTLKEFMRVLGYKEPGFPEKLMKETK